MADRHRKGYYADYAKRTGRKDRHSKGYYRKYNLEHPERLARVGIVLVDGVPCKEVVTKEVVKTDSLRAKIDAKLAQWHDDDWEEDSGD